MVQSLLHALCKWAMNANAVAAAMAGRQSKRMTWGTIIVMVSKTQQEIDRLIPETPSHRREDRPKRKQAQPRKDHWKFDLVLMNELLAYQRTRPNPTPSSRHAHQRRQA